MKYQYSNTTEIPTQTNTIPLKEILDIAKKLGKDDFWVIEVFANQKGIHSRVVQLLTNITTEKGRVLEEELHYIKALMIDPMSFYYQDYPHKTAEALDRLTRKMMLGYDFNAEDIEKMKDIKIKKNAPIYHDLGEIINVIQNNMHDVHFVDEERYQKYLMQILELRENEE